MFYEILRYEIHTEELKIPEKKTFCFSSLFVWTNIKNKKKWVCVRIKSADIIQMCYVEMGKRRVEASRLRGLRKAKGGETDGQTDLL